MGLKRLWQPSALSHCFLSRDTLCPRGSLGASVCVCQCVLTAERSETVKISCLKVERVKNKRRTESSLTEPNVIVAVCAYVVVFCHRKKLNLAVYVRACTAAFMASK